ncbi:Brother of CDO [Varanus komodoensis]|nr:Brother of CDO [Varanus komodoensis]
MKLKYFGHLMRRKDLLEKSLMLGTIDGKRRRDQQRMRWLDGVTEAVGVNLSGLQGIVKDRKAWRNVVHGVTMDLKDFKYDGQHVIEVDEGNTAVIACDLPESHPKAQVRYSVKQEWLEASRDNYLIMPSGNLQIVNASQDDEGTYKCAAYNPVTQEIKTSVSSERLRVRRKSPVLNIGFHEYWVPCHVVLSPFC